MLATGTMSASATRGVDGMLAHIESKLTEGKLEERYWHYRCTSSAHSRMRGARTF